VVAPVGSIVTFDPDGTPKRNLEIAPSPSAYFGAEGNTAAVLLLFIPEELLKIRLTPFLGPGRYAVPPTHTEYSIGIHDVGFPMRPDTAASSYPDVDFYDETTGVCERHFAINFVHRDGLRSYRRFAAT
jgi:hypothetical protein